MPKKRVCNVDTRYRTQGRSIRLTSAPQVGRASCLRDLKFLGVVKMQKYCHFNFSHLLLNILLTIPSVCGQDPKGTTNTVLCMGAKLSTRTYISPLICTMG
jgi:hypothetical protein